MGLRNLFRMTLAYDQVEGLNDGIQREDDKIIRRLYEFHPGLSRVFIGRSRARLKVVDQMFRVLDGFQNCGQLQREDFQPSLPALMAKWLKKGFISRRGGEERRGRDSRRVRGGDKRQGGDSVGQPKRRVNHNSQAREETKL